MNARNDRSRTAGRSARAGRQALVLALLPLTVLLAGAGCKAKSVSGAQPAPAASPQSGRAQTAPDGVVLVTDNLEIDFSKHLVTFIELGADRCIPCKAMQPIMKTIAAKFKGQVQVVFYDVWKNPEPGRKYGVQLIPTQVFIDRSGREIGRHVGLYPEDELTSFLKLQGVR